MLFFITIVKIRIINVHLIKKIIIVLFTEQILAAIYKLIFLGSSEKIVGTISTDSGGIATLFPLIGISLTFHIYQLTKKRKYFFLTPLFLIISYLSHKMAILFYMPILFIYSIITYNKYYNNSLIFFTHLKKFIIYAPLVFVMIYFMVRLNPRANIEQKAWGSFDLYYLKNEVERYTTKNKHVAGRHYSGRFSAFNLYLKDFIDRPLPNMLIGNGPGSVIKSSFLKGNYVDFTDKFGYGAKLGSLWFLEQIGLLGLIVFVYLQLVIYSKIKTSKNNSPLLILHSRSLMLIFILDFFTYSSVFIISAPITSYYYLIIGATLIGSNKMQLMIGKDRI